MGGTDYKLPEPFFVLATQNPIEQEGTYPLPEAQLDRFMFMIIGRTTRRPRRSEQIMQMATADVRGELQPVLIGRGHPAACSRRCGGCRWRTTCSRYAEKLVRVTRPKTPEAPDFVKKWLTWGAGPRAM